MQNEGDDYTISTISTGKGDGTATQVVFNSAPESTDKVDIYGVEANVTTASV
jgi:hypothetical protein